MNPQKQGFCKIPKSRLRLINHALYGIVAVFLSFVMFASTKDSKAQEKPALNILSPSPGSIIEPGQTVEVTLAMVGLPQTANAYIITNHNIQIERLAPLQFRLSIPVNMDLGVYNIRAFAGTHPNEPVVSAKSSIIVDKSMPYASLQTNAPWITLRYPGRTYQIIPYGIDADGNKQHIERAAGITYQSQDNTVATVDQRGRVTGISAGDTSIEVSLGGVSTVVNIQVNKSERPGDFNGDSAVNESDMNELKAYVGINANGTNDARDLNRDGKIDAADTQILKTLFTNFDTQ